MDIHGLSVELHGSSTDISMLYPNGARGAAGRDGWMDGGREAGRVNIATFVFCGFLLNSMIDFSGRWEVAGATWGVFGANKQNSSA